MTEKMVLGLVALAAGLVSGFVLGYAECLYRQKLKDASRKEPKTPG